ncbi:MAG: DNA cytosine methyltransferase [Planctomycetes bacterium]|nr:DNA cytosine methyltransferase [Planctomycetota bacterium]
MPSADTRPTAIDLFSGAGGLTLGLEKAGFRVVAAVEVSEKVSETFRANHPNVVLLTKDICNVTGKDVLEAAGVESVDLVAGCPPCQGFSKLTDKYEKEDPRNRLVLEMARLVVELKPRTLMMENVPGLAQRGKLLLDAFLGTVRDAGYQVDAKVLQLANYGVPQSRRRLVALGGLGFAVPMPKPTHSRLGDKMAKLARWLTLKDALAGLNERPVTFKQAKRDGGPQKHEWHVVGDLSEVTLDRLRAVKAGTSRETLPMDLRPKCHQKVKAGFQNVYGRMAWDKIPPTITGGCTTPCKGRYGHPRQLRTISVREAALIQTFPKSYKFVTDEMGTACAMVGNALPPKFAAIAATQCLASLPGSRVTADG